MAYWDEYTMLRLGLGRWAPLHPAEKAQVERPKDVSKTRQDGAERKVESGAERD